MFNGFIASQAGLDDAASYIWLIWHTAKNYLSGGNVFFTNLLFYPSGTSLVMDTPILNGLVSLPFFLVGGPVAAYNFLVIFTFLMTFWGFYLLFNHLTGSKTGATIGALTITFSAYRLTMFSMGQIDLLSTEWIGFSLFFLLKYLRDNKPKALFLASVFFAATAYTDYRTFIISAFLTTVILALHLRKIKQVISFLAISALLLQPLFILHLGNLGLKPEYLEKDSPRLIAADFVAFAYPFYNLRSHYYGLAISFIGFLSLLALPVSFWISAGNRKLKELIYPFYGIFVLFFALSLGDSLNVFGNMIFESRFMPFGLLKDLPGMAFFRSPVRFSLGVNIAAAAITAIVFSEVLKNIESLKTKTIIILVALFLATFQNFFFIPKPSLQKMPSSEGLTKLRELPSGTVLHVPLGSMDSYNQPHGNFDPEMLMSQVAHNKPLIGGYLSYVNPKILKNLLDDTFIQRLFGCQKLEDCTEDKKIAAEFESKNNLKYILINKSVTDREVTFFIYNSFKTTTISEDSDYLLLELD